MSRVPLDPVDPDNMDLGCNMERETTYGANIRCGSTPDTSYRLPSLGIYVFVCKRHASRVEAYHPDAEEIGL